MPETASALPATVVAAHLEACAAELATRANPAELGELAEVLRLLIEGQRHVAGALDRLAGLLPAEGPVERAALAEVLRAAAIATGYSADALAETRTPLGMLLRTDDEDTRL